MLGRRVAFLIFVAGCSGSMSAAAPDDAAVAGEVEALHEFFVRWFRGEVPDSDEGFAPLPRALGDDFVIVSPSGAMSERAAILEGIRGMHGDWGPADGIEIKAVKVRARRGDAIVATYEEWQQRADALRGRVSTVVFDTQLRWLHVHETWLPQ